MTAQDYRISINELLSEVHDDTVLEACYEILKNAVKISNTHIVGHETNDTPITKSQLENDADAYETSLSDEELLEMIEESERNFEEGNFHTMEEVDKMIESWKNR